MNTSLTPNESTEKVKLSALLLAVAAIMGLFVALGMYAENFYSIHAARHAVLNTNIRDIMLLSEELSTLAVAAVSGEDRPEAASAYQEADARMEALRSRVSRLEGEKDTVSFLTASLRWRERLSRVERKALGLGRSGRLKEAQDLLHAGSYLQDRESQRQELALADASIEAEETTLDRQGESRRLVFTGLGVVSVSIVVLLWYYAMKGVDRRLSAEMELRASSRRFESIVENSQDIVSVQDPSGVVSFVSPSVERVLGRKPEEVVGASVVELVDAADATGIQTALARLADNPDEPVSFTFRMTDIDGRVHVLESISVHQPGDEENWDILSVSRDITQRMSDQKEIERSMSLLNATLDATYDGILVTDAGGDILAYNETYLRMWGVPADAALSHPELRQFVADRFDSPEGYLAAMREVSLGAEAEKFEVLELADGRVFERFSKPQIVGEDVIGRVWSFRDVTERVRFRRSLERAEERYRSVVENIPSVVWMADSNGRILYVSPASSRVFGFAPEDVGDSVAGAWLSRLHADDIDAVTAAYAGLFNTGYLDVTCQMQREDDRFIWVHFTAKSVLQEDGSALAYGFFSDITAEKQADEALKSAKVTLEHMVAQRTQELDSANDRLMTQIEELKNYSRESLLLSELGDQLQACITIEEATAVVADASASLFPEASGGLYLFKESRNIVERTSFWGETGLGAEMFAPDQCWALRRGRLHLESASGRRMCGHLVAEDKRGTMCVPMIAQGETMGVLHLVCGPDSEEECLSESRQRLANTLAEHAALAVANLRLRDALRAMSIHDPLTGLYNRRYMEESLERELRKASRAGYSIGIIMIDIDHFKEFNDVHGHPAGDALLAAFGAFLDREARAEDLDCRYGGEEFVLIMPDLQLETAAKRAGQIVERARALEVDYLGKPLRGITISAGVASFPEFGSSGDEVISAADTALYRAKHAGRDRAVTAVTA